MDAFLERRNNFFQKFNSEQRLELCRVLELVSIYGKNTLFKQGSVGQAFYIILSGQVDVLVKNGTETEDSSNPDGILVNTLYAGGSFGERAFEGPENLRAATVITGEGLTELLVISKEDYLSLVSVMVKGEMAFKCAVLRKTLTFKNVDFHHLVSYECVSRVLYTFSTHLFISRSSKKFLSIWSLRYSTLIHICRKLVLR